MFDMRKCLYCCHMSRSNLYWIFEAVYRSATTCNKPFRIKYATLNLIYTMYIVELKKKSLVYCFQLIRLAHFVYCVINWYRSISWYRYNCFVLMNGVPDWSAHYKHYRNSYIAHIFYVLTLFIAFIVVTKYQFYFVINRYIAGIVLGIFEILRIHCCTFYYLFIWFHWNYVTAKRQI